MVGVDFDRVIARKNEKIDRLTAEIAEAREDSRRLDTLQRWLDNLLVLEILFEPDTQMTVIPDQNDSIDNMGADDIRVSGDLRAAIDAGEVE